MSDYQALPYRGREYGLWHAPTRNWCIFGTFRAMRRRAAELNAPDHGARAARIAADLIAYPLDRAGYAERVRELIADGLSNSDAQAVADTEDMP